MQCRPIHIFWDREKDFGHGCFLRPMTILYVAGIPHLVLEVAILLCPLIEIWRLHLTTTKKMAVAVMFVSGVLVCCSAMGTILHTVALNKNHTDLTWNGLDDQIWAVCDVNLASLSSQHSPSTSRVLSLTTCSVTTPPPPRLPQIRWHIQQPWNILWRTYEWRH